MIPCKRCLGTCSVKIGCFLAIGSLCEGGFPDRWPRSTGSFGIGGGGLVAICVFGFLIGGGGGGGLRRAGASVTAWMSVCG